MGIYDVIANADESSNSGVYFQPGDYLVTLTGVRLFQSRKDGTDVFVVEAKVDEVLLEYPDSNKVGETASMVRNFSKQPKMSAADAKEFIAAAAEVEFTDVTPKTVELAVKDDGAAFVGLQMKVHAYDRTTKSGGNFTVVKWSISDDIDDIPVT